MKDPRFLFSKDELPTWNEFHKFINIRNFSFNKERDIIPDPYWKYPSQLMNLAWCCNQLNKFLYEKENYHNSYWILESSNLNMIDGYLEKVHCRDFDNINFPIYHCVNPTTKKYSEFITNDCFRIDIADIFNKDVDFELVLLSKSLKKENSKYPHVFRDIDGSFHRIMHDMIAPVESYYQEPIGWKD